MSDKIDNNPMYGNYECRCGQPVDRIGEKCSSCREPFSLPEGVADSIKEQLADMTDKPKCPMCNGSGEGTNYIDHDDYEPPVSKKETTEPTYKCPYCDIAMTEVEPYGSDHYCDSCGWGNYDAPIEECIEFVNKCLERYNERQD